MTRDVVVAVALLLATVTGGGAAVMHVHGSAQAKMAEKRHQHRLGQLHHVLAPETHDNDLLADTRQIRSSYLGTREPVTVYLARMGDEPAGIIVPAVATREDGVTIDLLAGVRADGALSAVRLLSPDPEMHPGEVMPAPPRHWIRDLDGREAENLMPGDWTAEGDGEDEATRTPSATQRAVVQAVEDLLAYFGENGTALYSDGPSQEATGPAPANGEEDGEEASNGTAEDA